MSKYIVYALVTAAVVAAIVLVVKIISGAITLINGLFNVILGVIVVLAVIALVVWMFRYAAKHNDENSHPIDKSDGCFRCSAYTVRIYLPMNSSSLAAYATGARCMLSTWCAPSTKR